jgi:hypothetical protein
VLIFASVCFEPSSVPGHTAFIDNSPGFCGKEASAIA